MAKLSIVVCVYNTNENYFDECLFSIFNSTITNFEVIVVDDGSTVDYQDILKKYPNIKYVKTENQGTLKARMLGISLATGKYLCFVDSDDTISFNYFEASMKKILAEKADIVLNDWAFNCENPILYCANDSTIKKNLIFTDNEPLSHFFAQEGKEHSYYVLWNKIFKKEVLTFACKQIKKFNVDRLIYAEDLWICYYAFMKAKKLVNTHLGYYYYRMHSLQETFGGNKNKLMNHIDSDVEVFSYIEQDLKSRNLFETFSTKFIKWKNLACSNHYLNAKRNKYFDLYAYIKMRFETKKLKNPPFDSAKSYKKQKVLTSNINEIDFALKNVYNNNNLKVFARKNSYAYKTLLKSEKIFNTKYALVKSKKLADVVVPDEKNVFIQQLLHNDFIRNLSAFFFPYGSRIRKFLKSKLVKG